MSRNNLLLIIVLVLGISSVVLLSFLGNDEARERATLIANLLSSISGLLTLLIAIFIYRKFSLEPEIKSKQLTAVEEMLNKIKKTRMIFSLDTEGTSGMVQFFPLRIDSYIQDFTKKGPMSHPEWRGNALLFGIDYMNFTADLCASLDNHYLPKELVKPLQNLYVSVIYSNVKVNENKIIKVSVPGFMNNETKSMWGKLNNKDITILEYFSLWKDLMLSIKKWYAKEFKSSDDSALNL